MSLTMLAGQLLALRAQVDATLATVQEMVDAESTRRQRLQDVERADAEEANAPLKMPPVFGAARTVTRETSTAT